MPTIANGSSRNTPEIQPQVTQQSPLINLPASPSPDVGYTEQPEQCYLALGDFRYTYQEVRAVCAKLHLPPKPPSPVPASYQSFDPSDHEPFPPYVDPFTPSLTLSEFAYFDIDGIRDSYQRNRGRPMTFEPDPSSGSCGSWSPGSGSPGSGSCSSIWSIWVRTPGLTLHPPIKRDTKKRWHTI